MPKAIWNGAVIAESDQCKEIEGNQYFPPEAVNKGFLAPSSTNTVCSWKGVASYYDVKVNGELNKDAAWYYANPKEEAKEIAGYIAFWKGVKVR